MTVVAGVGFRRDAAADAIVSLVERALREAAVAREDLVRLATVAGLADATAFRDAARRLAVEPAPVDPAALRACDPAVPTRSTRVLAAYGVGSVAEAAALAAAGPGATLLLARIASASVTCALARGGSADR